MRAGSLLGRTATLALALTSLGATAQQVVLEPSAAVRCLRTVSSTRDEPEYPFKEWKGEQKGRVQVELVFTAPDAEPDIKVLQSEGGDRFVDAVSDFAETLRLPCLNDVGGGPVRIRFDYVFQPDSRRVQWARPTDQYDEKRRKMLDCVKHPSGEKAPSYPTDAQYQQLQGRVLARLRFAAADKPPTVEVFHRRSARLLAATASSWSAGLRMPCFEGTEAVEGTWAFIFRLDDDVYGFKPLDLRSFISRVRDIQRQRVQFDLNTMACPFDLQLQYRQPDLPNRVGELGDRQAARRPFIEWLEAQQLALPERSLDSIYGDTTTLSIPCGKIDLKPKENP